MAAGDMEFQKAVDEQFDNRTDAGLRRFQARHGLLINGIVDEVTLHSLAVPADFRLTQLRLNAMRLQFITPTVNSQRHVVVNIPAAFVEAVEGGQVSQRHTAVVGRIERPTPILDSKIHQINFNPYWNVPKSIIQKDLIKYMNEDPEYLTKWKIHIYDGKGNEIMPHEVDWSTDEAVKYQFRQEPGAENSMGHVKINFYNPYDVYMHDTPQKGLFAENARFHSSGCMRIENVADLVAWLLRDNGGWDINTVTAAFESNERLDVDVANPVPVHTTYISAWANRTGTVSFRSDVYDFDEFGRVTFEGTQVG
jgi:murein L,D-transpeptidase YcbB/YkuD